MKRNDLNAIITGIVHRYIEDGWVLEMDNVSYSDVVGVHFLSRGRERVAVGIRRPELKEVAEGGRYANLRGLDSRILFECRAPKGSFDWVELGNVISDACSSRSMVIGTSMMPVRRMERRPRGARGRGATSTAMPLPVHSTPPRRSSTSGFARCTDGRTSSPPMSS